MKHDGLGQWLTILGLAVGWLQADQAQGQDDDASAAMQAHAAMQARLQSSANPDPTVAARTVQVQVVDEEAQPVAGQPIALGIMDQDGQRTALSQTTNDQGLAVFSALSTEGTRSYRAKTTWQGATFGAPPFRLAPDQGVLVRLVRLPVSEDERPMLQHGQFIMELRDQRLHVIQHARLSNFGTQAYLFPKQGKLIELPKGYANLQLQELMGDQRMVEDKGKGFRVYGSLVPGTITLSWSYHLPVSGSQMVFDVPTNWNTYRYQVVIVAIDGLKLSVNDLEVTEFEHEGRTLLGTELRRAPQEAPLPSIQVSLEGIPGPGPLRWIALGIAACLALGLAWLLGRKNPAQQTADTQSQKAALIEQVAMLEKQRQDRDIGPNFYETERLRIMTELALLLRQEASTRASGTVARET